jgi:hypothetical protein
MGSCQILPRIQGQKLQLIHPDEECFTRLAARGSHGIRGAPEGDQRLVLVVLASAKILRYAKSRNCKNLGSTSHRGRNALEKTTVEITAKKMRGSNPDRDDHCGAVEFMPSFAPAVPERFLDGCP